MTLPRRPLLHVVAFSAFLILVSFSLLSSSALANQLSGDPGDAFVFPGESPVAPDGTSQWGGPSISGNLVFWTEYDSSTLKTRLFFKDLSLGEDEPGYALIEEQTSARTPAVSLSGNRVVWAEMVGAELHLYYKDQAASGGFESCSGTSDECASPLAPGYYWQENPAISPDGSKVAYEYGRSHDSQIHIYDFNTGVEQELYSMPGGDQQFPSVNNEWVVWEDNRDFNSFIFPLDQHIYAKRIGTADPPISIADNGHSAHASVGPAKVTRNLNNEPVVFYLSSIEDRYGHDTYTAHLYNLSSGTDQIIDEISGQPQNPSIDGDKIVWEDCTENAYCDVVLHDLSTGVTQVVSQDSDLGARNPEVSASSGYIVWLTSHLSPTTVYYNRLGDTAQALANEYAPELHFFHDYNKDERNDVEPRLVDLIVDGADRLITSGGDIDDPVIQDLIDHPEDNNFLDLPGSPANPFHSYEDDYKNQLGAGDYPVTAYAQVVQRAEETDKTVIQYWFNYYYNNWYNNHEGDWEMVEVILNDNLEPEDVAYAQHGTPWKKGWNEWGLNKTDDTHPQVFVAEGSHASYFIESNSLHFLEPGTPNAFADITGSASWIIPAVDLNGLAGGWVDFGGHWGQERPTLCPPPFCDSGPKGPAFQAGDPFNQPLTWLDSSFWKWLANDTAIAVYSPAEINLYDAQGHHVGKNAQGGIDLEIPGSEYFEREDDHSKNIVIHNEDILSNYTVKIEGTDMGTMDLKVQAPDFGGNMIENPQYLAVEVNPAMKAELDLNAARDFDLKVDEDGDGAVDTLLPPDTNDQVAVDFTPPAAVTDMTAAETTSGTATLNWTAPGDDSITGTAVKYDLRYSTEPITGENWQYANPVDSLPDPQVAGSTETATVTGLDAGTTYYFAIRSRDDTWQESALSNVVQSTTEIPNLTWGINRIYWASWDDYYARQLSIDYNLSNSGTGAAISSAIAASICNPTSVYVTTSLPLNAGDISPGSINVVTLKYYVPPSVGSFTTTTYTSCQDDAGRIYWFPEPLP